MISASNGNSEEWRPVVGYEGSYEVSSLGRIRSNIAKSKGLIRRLNLRKDGYVQVQLKVNQQPKNFLVHVLVDEAFNGPRVMGLEVNHKDGNKQNNSRFNLERVSRAGNVNHAFRMGLCGSRHGEANSFAKLNSEIVAQIRKEAALLMQSNGRLKYGACADLAQKYGIARTTVSGIVHGKSWEESQC